MAAFRILLVCALLVGVAAPGTRADDDQANALYGLGVHAYFDGLYSEADNLLSQSIGSGTKDPRPFYFRGLVHQMMGQTDLAGSDFQTAAQLETTSAGRAYDISGALERIQGPARMEIEKYRREAFAQAHLVRRKQNAAVNTFSPRVPSNSNAAPFDPKNLPDVSAIVDPTIPFPDTSAKIYFPPAKSAPSKQDFKVDVNAAQPAAGKPIPAADDPFSGGNAPKKSSEPAPKSGDGDPFGGDAAEKQPEKKAPDAEKDDPFGGG